MFIFISAKSFLLLGFFQEANIRDPKIRNFHHHSEIDNLYIAYLKRKQGTVRFLDSLTCLPQQHKILSHAKNLKNRYYQIRNFLEEYHSLSIYQQLCNKCRASQYLPRYPSERLKRQWYLSTYLEQSYYSSKALE